MSDSKSKNESKESIEDKFNKYKKDIQNERMFLFKINQLLNDEYEEIFEDILVLNEKQFMSELKNRVKKQSRIRTRKHLFRQNFLRKKIQKYFRKGIKLNKI